MSTEPLACGISEKRGWRNVCLPFLQWWPQITGRTLKADLLAGFTGAVVALPQGVAFATIAGMPPEYGLYTGMIPAIIAALFGSSWLLVSGPTTAASVVLFSALSAHAAPGTQEYVQLAITLTMMVGIIQLVLGLARFGALVNFISHSVVVGFTAGTALIIASTQLKHIFGVILPRTQHFHQTIHALYLNINDANLAACAVGFVTMAVGICCRRFFPKWPFMLTSMLVGCLFAWALGAIFGKQAVNIAMVGALPAKLPPLSAPHFTLEIFRSLAPAALATTLFALTEAVSIARSLADRTGQDLDGNQEFIGQGLSNIVGSFFSGYVATGSFNRSALNFQAGAKTPVAAILGGSFLIVLGVLVAPFAAYLPNAVMAGILLLVAWSLFDLPHIIKIYRTSLTEAVILTVTFVGTLVLSLEFAILLGIMLSLVIYLNRTSHPHVFVRVPDPHYDIRPFVTDPRLPECPQLRIVRIDGSLYFGAVNHVREHMRNIRRQPPQQKNLLIIARSINFIDMAGAEYLMQLTEDVRKNGGELYMLGIKEGICTHFRLAKYFIEIGTENIFETKPEALAEIYQRLDHNICAQCTKRIFLECGPAPSQLAQAEPAQPPQEKTI